MAKIKFGYKDIDESEKPSQVNTVFTSVSNKYDVMNDIMSFDRNNKYHSIMPCIMTICIINTFYIMITLCNQS